MVAFIAVGVALAKKATPPLTGTTHYDFVGNLNPQIVDSEGGLLCWVGTIEGDIGEADGNVIRWWLLSQAPHPAPPAQAGQMLFRWEILVYGEDGLDPDADLLLAGEERERTIARHQKNTVWRANGIVTVANGEYEGYLGSQMHEGGSVEWTEDDPPVPLEGDGKLRIAGSAAGTK